MTTETKDLLPCPFCGEGAEFKPYLKNGLTLKCKSLGCVTYSQRTLRHDLDWLRDRMTEHWNTRASATSAPEQPAEAFKKLSDDEVLWLAQSHGIDVYACNPLAFYADLISNTSAQPVPPAPKEQS